MSHNAFIGRCCRREGSLQTINPEPLPVPAETHGRDARATTLVAAPAALRCIAGFQPAVASPPRSEEHTSELQSQPNIVCRLLLDTSPSLGEEHTVLVTPKGSWVWRLKGSSWLVF